MLRRTNASLAAAAVALVSLGGCHFDYILGPDSGWGDGIGSHLLAVLFPAGGELSPGDSLHIVWEGTHQPDVFKVDLYLSGSLHTELANSMVNDGDYWWSIPTDFPVDAELADEYHIVLSGYHAGVGDGTLLMVATSAPFSILPEATSGLSDVTVTATSIVVTLTDNGQLIDGDTVDLILGGVLQVAGHVLVGGAGTAFPLTLTSGDNLFEIRAVNEGTAPPNTALLQISDVVAGEESQQWRLATGEVGRVTITAP